MEVVYYNLAMRCGLHAYDNWLQLHTSSCYSLLSYYRVQHITLVFLPHERLSDNVLYYKKPTNGSVNT